MDYTVYSHPPFSVCGLNTHEHGLKSTHLCYGELVMCEIGPDVIEAGTSAAFKHFRIQKHFTHNPLLYC